MDINAAVGENREIAPSFSLETIRSLILDFNTINKLIKYEAVESLIVKLDPKIANESIITLDASNTTLPDSVDFAKTAKFSDGTSWFDRYIYINPNNINVTIKEVNYNNGMI